MKKFFSTLLTAIMFLLVLGFFVSVVVPIIGVIWLITLFAEIFPRNRWTSKEPVKVIVPKLSSAEWDGFSLWRNQTHGDISPETTSYLQKYPQPEKITITELLRAVDESNVNMSDMAKKRRRALRHSLRGNDGRFVKRSLEELTRYGQSKVDRWNGL